MREDRFTWNAGDVIIENTADKERYEQLKKMNRMDLCDLWGLNECGLDSDDEEYREFCKNDIELIKRVLKEMDEDDEYCPSATAGDYSPSCPWNAPGMSIHDFI